MKIVGRNDLKIDLLPNIKIQSVLHVEHTINVRRPPLYLAATELLRSIRFIKEHGELFQIVQCIIAHKTRGRAYKFLTSYKGTPEHEVV